MLQKLEVLLFQDVWIQKSVIVIGICAFSWCSSLKDIVIPNSVTEIGLEENSLSIIFPKHYEPSFWRCIPIKKVIIIRHLNI